MFVPFCGHVISGVLLLLNVYYEAWDPRLLGWARPTGLFLMNEKL